MNSHTKLGELWKQVKTASGQRVAAPRTHPDPESEAWRLITVYADRASSRQLSPAILTALDEQRPEQEAVILRTCGEDKPTDTAFTLKELQKTLRPKPDTATILDRISYSMIQQAGPASHEKILRVINDSYTAGRLPLARKEATIQPIPKPKEPGKTRPISLLSCLGKTAERMVLNRLQWFTGPLHDNIYAYTRGLGTRDCLLDMLTTITGKGAVVIFRDIEKVFFSWRTEGPSSHRWYTMELEANC